MSIDSSFALLTEFVDRNLACLVHRERSVVARSAVARPSVVCDQHGARADTHDGGVAVRSAVVREIHHPAASEEGLCRPRHRVRRMNRPRAFVTHGLNFHDSRRGGSSALCRPDSEYSRQSFPSPASFTHRIGSPRPPTTFRPAKITTSRPALSDGNGEGVWTEVRTADEDEGAGRCEE